MDKILLVEKIVALYFDSGCCQQDNGYPGSMGFSEFICKCLDLCGTSCDYNEMIELCEGERFRVL